MELGSNEAIKKAVVNDPSMSSDNVRLPANCDGAVGGSADPVVVGRDSRRV